MNIFCLHFIYVLIVKPLIYMYFTFFYCYIIFIPGPILQSDVKIIIISRIIRKILIYMVILFLASKIYHCKNLQTQHYGHTN